MRRFTRREALAGAAGVALGAAGIYELVDQFAGSSPKRPAGVHKAEQHLLYGVRVVSSNDVEVLVPPLHHEVITARVNAARSDVRSAQSELAHLLDGLEADYEPTPAGLGVTLAWGLPYFNRLVPDQLIRVDRIFTAHQVPRRQPLRARKDQKVLRVFSYEQTRVGA